VNAWVQAFLMGEMDDEKGRDLGSLVFIWCLFLQKEREAIKLLL